MPTPARAGLPLALALVSLCACGPEINVSDDIDDQWDRRPSHSYNNVLHSPYVLGAAFEIHAYDASEGYALDDWTISSSDPDVLRVESVSIERAPLNDDDDDASDTDIVTAQVTAVGEGTALVEIRKPNGKIAEEFELQVRRPDEVVLRAAGPLFIEQGELAPDLVDTTPQLLADGIATFMVEWWGEGQRLHGTGVLGLSSDYPELIGLQSATRHLDEQREWARVSFAASEGPASAEVEFLANGVPAASVTFDIVEDSAIERLELVSQDTTAAAQREVLAVLSRALDANDESIWGVACDWDLDGRTDPDEGDIYRYYYDPSAASLLEARFGELLAQTEIAGEVGFVVSSNDDLGSGFDSCFCSVPVEGDAPRGITLALLSLLALAGLRPRRRA